MRGVVLIPALLCATACEEPLVHQSPEVTLARTGCGDGVRQPPEECDRGTLNDDATPDACRTDCTLPSCGDGVADTGEECDDANRVNGDGCNADCTAWSWTWSRDIAGNRSDGILAATVDSQNNVIVTGYTHTAAWIGKLDADGSLEWSTTYDGPTQSRDFGTAVVVDADDNVLVAGVQGFQPGYGAVLLLALDADGVILWTATRDGPGVDAAHSIALEPSGDILVGGSLADDTVPWIGRYGTDGTLHEELTPTGTPRGLAVAEDGIVVAATTAVSMLDSGGNEIWSDAWDNGGVEDVVVDPDGNPVAVGYKINPYAVSVRKYDATGFRLWNLNLDDGDVGYDIGTSVDVDADGNIVAAGIDARAGEAENVWVALFDPNGQIQWSRSHDGPVSGVDLGFAVIIDQNGGIVAAGVTTGVEHTEDVWVRKYMR